METPAEKVDLKTDEQVESVEKIKDTDVSSPTDEKDKLVEEKKEKVPAITVHKKDFEKDIVYLYQFSRCPQLASCSPFCLKVESFLRMAEINYQNVDHKLRYRSKKGQLPFVELNGKEIADSDIIIKELSEYFGKNLDANLTEDQKTVSYALESMLNNHTSWIVRWWRFNNPQGFLDVTGLDLKQNLNSRLPKPFCNLGFKIFFKTRAKQTIGHGIGRHTPEEIHEFGKKDISRLSQALGTKQYFFGNEPHLLDCSAFAHLTQFIYTPFWELDKWIQENHQNLIDFVNRFKVRFFPDWERMCKSLELNTHLYKEGEEPPMSEAEKKALEIKKQKEEAKKAKEEAKKAKEEQKAALEAKKLEMAERRARIEAKKNAASGGGGGAGAAAAGKAAEEKKPVNKLEAAAADALDLGLGDGGGKQFEKRRLRRQDTLRQKRAQAAQNADK